MPETISLDDWLPVIDREYLSTFVREGGASIKFAVTPDELKAELYRRVRTRCRELDYIPVEFDATIHRAHMAQDLFFSLAGQVDWRSLARRMILKLAAERNYGVAGLDPAESGNIFQAIAEANGLEPASILLEIRRDIQDHVFKNRNLARDFRVCMTHLCLLENTFLQANAHAEYAGQPLLDWLTGYNTRISNIRPFSIYTSINRATARYFIESALYWIRHVGRAGTVMLLDNARVTLSRNPKDGRRYYTRPMAMDHYELLREFIDGVDRLAGTLLIVVANSDFDDDTNERRSRGFGIYQALRTRVMNDVHDRNRLNPVASLVRLSE